MKHPLVHLEEVSKTYPSGFTLKVDRLKIDSAERVGLVGNNGAGKTTLLLLTLGLLQKDGGLIRMSGANVSETGEWRRRTASFLGDSSLIPFLTPQEYWSFVASAYGLRRSEVENRLKKLDDFVKAPAFGNKKLIRDFSTGNRKKIGLTAAMIVQPELLVLDEPFAGLDPRSQERLRELLAELNERKGTALFVSSHDLVHVVEFCRRIVVLDRGRIMQDAPVCAGSLREITSYLTERGGGTARKATETHSNPLESHYRSTDPRPKSYG